MTADTTDPKIWIERADEDFRAACVIAEQKKELWSQIGFLLQQAAEKYLKAFLISKQIRFPKTHNLEYLQDLCTDIEQEFNNIDFGNLTSYAVDFRYPIMFSANEKKGQNIEQYFEIVTKVKNIVISHI